MWQLQQIVKEHMGRRLQHNLLEDKREGQARLFAAHAGARCLLRAALWGIVVS